MVPPKEADTPARTETKVKERPYMLSPRELRDDSNTQGKPKGKYFNTKNLKVHNRHKRRKQREFRVSKIVKYKTGSEQLDSFNHKRNSNKSF